MKYKMQLENIVKSYSGKIVLNGLNLNVNEGEFLVVLGPSGEGKSTLLKAIVGIEDIDSGKIIVNGNDVTKKQPNKRNIAMVFQNYALYPNMTTYQNIMFPLKMQRTPRKEADKKVRDVAKLLKIEAQLAQNVTKLSGGQQQRVAIARALVRDPALFLLDEPLSNLDARIRYTSRQELKRLQKELNYTFVYVTHDQTEAANLADRVAVLHNGVIEQIGTYEDIYERPVTRWVGDFIGSFPMNFIDGDLIGYTGKVIGFRTRWTEPGNDIKGIVNLVQYSEGTYYIHCSINDSQIVIRTTTKYNVDDEISFSLKRFNVYDNGKLEDTKLVSESSN